MPKKTRRYVYGFCYIFNQIIFVFNDLHNKKLNVHTINTLKLLAIVVNVCT